MTGSTPAGRVAAGMVRIRWETITFRTADVPRASVPAEILAGQVRGDRVEVFLDQLIAGNIAREIGDDGGTILEIEDV